MTPEQLARVPSGILDPDEVAQAVVALVADPDSAGRVVELRCGEAPRAVRDEDPSARVAGVLIAESLRVGATLQGVNLRVEQVSRADVGDLDAGQPRTWAFVHFDAPADEAEALAGALSGALQREGGWYCDFRSRAETFVVFSGRVFRYPRGDKARRAEVEDYARSAGVPDAQLDWRD
jgi:hypothetical protein